MSTMTNGRQKIAEEPNDPSAPRITRTCAKCLKLDVCTIFRAIIPLIEKWDGTHKTGDMAGKPFETEDLATICRKFLHVDIMSLMGGL